MYFLRCFKGIASELDYCIALDRDIPNVHDHSTVRSEK